MEQDLIGDGFWASGISVAFHQGEDQRSAGWSAQAEYNDDGFLDDFADIGRVSTQGTLQTRYNVKAGDDDRKALTAVIDAIKADGDRLGIRWGGPGDIKPHVHYKNDGEDTEFPPPGGWRALLDAESVRLGWEPAYTQ